MKRKTRVGKYVTVDRVRLYVVKVDENKSHWNKCLILVTLKSGNKSNILLNTENHTHTLANFHTFTKD